MSNGYLGIAKSIVGQINSGKPEYQYPTSEPFITELLRGQLMAQISLSEELSAMNTALDEGRQRLSQHFDMLDVSTERMLVMVDRHYEAMLEMNRHLDKITIVLSQIAERNE